MFLKNIYIETKVETALAIWGYIFVMLIDDYYLLCHIVCHLKMFTGNIYFFCLLLLLLRVFVTEMENFKRMEKGCRFRSLERLLS